MYTPLVYNMATLVEGDLEPAIRVAQKSLLSMVDYGDREDFLQFVRLLSSPEPAIRVLCVSFGLRR